MAKKHHPFPIKTTIYPDRFLYKNKNEVDKLREQVVVIQKKISYLKECLNKYENFNGGNSTLTHLFQ